MNSLKVNLKNCFGIQSLEHEFNFSSNSCVLIYAPNGVMKSSFAKTFNCISKDDKKIKPCDLIYPNREVTAEILCDGKKIDPACIFVVDAESDINTNDKITTLLASKELKSQYDEIYQILDVAKKDFLKKLKEKSQSSDCEVEIVSTFKQSEKDDFFDSISTVKDEIKKNTVFFAFRYNDVFDKKGNIKKFLEKYKNLIQEYFSEYNHLLAESDFFKKNEDGTSFGTYQAKQIISSVDGDAFFSAKHKIVLSNRMEITSKSQLEEIVNNEINKILDDEKLKAVFEKIDNAIGANVELRAFKAILEKDKAIIPNLLDYEGFKKQVWYGFLSELQTDVEKLLDLYASNKTKLSSLLDEAKRENEAWKEIVDIYNERFYVPFKVTIENQEDVILKQDTANLVFWYKDHVGEYVKKDRNELINVLSRGEKRAFFILQLLFELEARKKSKIETLVILDDVAESFDYKNKYAIIEYICDLKEDNLFKQVILTHNFDFYRTLDSRLNLGTNVFMAIRNNNNVIDLKQGKYRRDVFEKHLSRNARDEKVFISLIPFVRNILEYTKGTSSTDYVKLTGCLHIMPDSHNITVGNICDIYKETIASCSNLSIENNDEAFVNFVKKVASDIVNKSPIDEILLENKLVLSICIRLLTEEYIIKRLNDDEAVASIKSNQTRKLINLFKSRFPTEKYVLQKLDRVNLMTPENIHINAFMYEPLIDMSVNHLVDLYKDISALQDIGGNQ